MPKAKFLKMGSASLAIVLAFALTAGAAVKKQEKTQVKFEGMLGTMMRMFGGGKAADGITETVAVKGNRKSTMGEERGQIVDLDEEKVYDIDIKGKSYRVQTFDDIRKKFTEEQENAKKEMAKMQQQQGQQPPADQQMQFDVDIKETGATKNINTYDCKEVVLSVAAHPKGKTLDDGGMLTEMHLWLTPKIAGMEEITDFDLRYFKKLNLPFDPALMQQMAAAMAANPYMGPSMEKIKMEAAKMEGVAVLTVTTFQAVASKEVQAQAQQQQAQSDSAGAAASVPTSKKGLFGGIAAGMAKKVMQKKSEEKNDEGVTATPGRATIMTSTSELLKLSSDVTDADVAIPAGFKQKN